MSDYVETGKEACCYCGEDFPEEMDPVRQSSDGVVFLNGLICWLSIRARAINGTS